jgi:predicted unusual protein kinase regulating ubiquinone biosynthesis (AarF/ABC1/UbiB family)
MSDKPLPTGRIQRLGKIGRAAAGAAVKQAGTRTANVARSPERADRALEHRQVETAMQIVKVLGGMKGAAMKIGQVLSFVDVGLVPEEYREQFQAELAKLRDAAPTVSLDRMRGVIETEIGEPIERAFAEFDPEPIAAASIGQVYRARLEDGQPVAVKVQYPGIAAAVEADMQNLGLILRLVRRITPQADVKAVGEEIKERVIEELDYELEAQNQRTMARLYRNHPFIVIPSVVRSLSTERVLVTELVEGTGFEALRKEGEAERNRIGEIVFRFYFGSMYRHRRFSGDPHPGNMMRMADGRVAFIDFGLFKTLEPAAVALELACQRAATEGDASELHRLFASAGFLPQPERLAPEPLMAYVIDAISWYTRDEEVEITPELVGHIAIQSSDPRSSHFEAMRHQDINPEHVIGRRLELLMLAVLGQLGATNNWHRIAREWMYGDPPVTELGRQETEFFGAPPAPG